MKKRRLFFLVVAIVAAAATIFVWTNGIPDFGAPADQNTTAAAANDIDWTTILVTMIGSATSITCAVLATRRPSAPN